jgi:hypothetical protein
MAYRMVEYWPLIKRRFRQPLRQVVLYVGQAKQALANRLDEDDLRFSYGVMDIRQIDAEVLMSGNHGDLALAVLAGGGELLLREILQQAAIRKGPRRDRLLAKILVLSGLRGIAGKVEWGVEKYGRPD